ncbi:MAG: DEAD/DEAH box helicase family protein [Candidatus ainarchaeum sp.]|nr:DEAD/DEAH box helicase family protein [Candidatus ainarchaeum sp.]MDD3086192.1 DEAD/DEAH box helicase family protein [Candidatus ainarchaeum sp.]MDD4128801.1 DEAD/DEAH box helicase family protein [Candidatus ainarchaeum sp.]
MNSLFRGPTLRQWQTEAISAWEKHRYGIIQAVPGAGKTILAVRMLTKKLEEEPNLKILIVCPRLTLIQQWVDSIKEYSTLKDKDIYEISSNNESKAYVCAQNKLDKYKVFICTFHQIKQFFNECNWKNQNWFLIVDEMHNTTENYKFPNQPIKYKLGLSATPKKKGKNADFNLGGIVYTYSFTQALQDKIILDPVIKIVFYSVNKQLFKKIQNESDSTVDLVESAYNDFLPDDADALESIMLSPINKKEKKLTKAQEAQLQKNQELEGAKETNKDEASDVFSSKSTDFLGIIRLLKEQFHIGMKDSVQSLVFVNRIKKADLLNQILAKTFSESVSHSYHSKSDNYSQKNYFNDLKKQFSEGKFNVLISVGTLGEGIDFPYASHGIIASPIYNPTSFVQKVGRLLRSYKDHRKAVIYYYVPSELISRLLTDERIEPNYFKSVIKIADQNSDLYFVDRESLHEQKGTLSELLTQGSAYDRNEDVKRIKVPHDLDSIMRFFKRIYPERVKEWKKLYESQVEDQEKEIKKLKKNINDLESIEKVKKEHPIDFTPLRKEIAKNNKLMYNCTINFESNLKNILTLQKKFQKKSFEELDSIKSFVKLGLKQNIITKIKFGHELEEIEKEKSVLSLSEQEMLKHAISAELSDFCNKSKQLEKCLNSISSARELIDKANKELKEEEQEKERINAMMRISKSFFDIQSLFLDELDLSEIVKNKSTNESKFFITIGKDIFLTKQLSRKFSYPEDFGLSRWREEKEEPKIVIQLTPVEKFAKQLMWHLSELEKQTGSYAIKDWEELKKKVCEEAKIAPPQDNYILAELEKHKFEAEFSFEKLFFVTEAIKRKK